MATITDIRINGQQTSESIVPTIAGLLPTFTWEFEENAADPSQYSIEIRVGTSSDSWGFNEFIGNRLAIDEVFSANSYTYSLYTLRRSITYYGQIRATDIEDDVFPWVKFSFTTNTLPYVSNHSLSPSSPVSTDDIELSYTYADDDSHEESGTKIRWFKNGLYQSSYDDRCILPSSALSSQDSWYARIIPSDGLEYGIPVDTASVTIAAPTLIGESTAFSVLMIVPTDANVDDLLKLEYQIADDEYTAISGTVTIEWFINDVAVPDSNQTTIRLSLNPGDVIHVVITILDGTNVIVQEQTEDLVISDVPWYVTNLKIAGMTTVENLVELNPILTWNTHKTTAAKTDQPDYLHIQVTKTLSRNSPIYDSGLLDYVRDYFVMPEDILERGKSYYIHVGVGDDRDILEFSGKNPLRRA